MMLITKRKMVVAESCILYVYIWKGNKSVKLYINATFRRNNTKQKSCSKLSMIEANKEFHTAF